MAESVNHRNKTIKRKCKTQSITDRQLNAPDDSHVLAARHTMTWVHRNEGS